MAVLRRAPAAAGQTGGTRAGTSNTFGQPCVTALPWERAILPMFEFLREQQGITEDTQKLVPGFSHSQQTGCMETADAAEGSLDSYCIKVQRQY